MAIETPGATTPGKKVIIDTDPGIDDAMAIFLAFNSPELHVIGLTTVFGNVSTEMATYNALHLCEFAGKEHIPVSQGSSSPLEKRKSKESYPYFIHGEDGLGNTHPPPPKGSVTKEVAHDFLIKKVKEFPGEVTIVALGPLTNLAMAAQRDPEFAKSVGQIVLLGGAFFVNGNMTPAAEANVFSDPEAADIVFTCGANITTVGINITHQVFFSDEQMKEVAQSKGRFGKYLSDIAKCYFDYHHTTYGITAIYLHDPATIVAAIDPSLLSYREGVVRVQTEGLCRGLTLLSDTHKNWVEPTEWCNRPSVKVAVTVDADKVSNIIKDRLSA